MSISNPSETTKNPTSRWFSWEGGRDGGFISYYDKDKKENIKCGIPFAFIVLDTTSAVKGWHDASESGISSNEVRDTKAEAMIVKAFKGGVLAEGIYSQIRDRIAAHGGKFVSNIYIAFKDGATVKLGCLQLCGAALNAWVEFCKAQGAQFDPAAAFAKKGLAVSIAGVIDGKKGSVVFKTPKFSTVAISEQSKAEAAKIDSEVLQPHLSAYFKKTTVEKVHAPQAASGIPSDDEIAADLEKSAPVNPDDVPF